MKQVAVKNGKHRELSEGFLVMVMIERDSTTFC